MFVCPNGSPDCAELDFMDWFSLQHDFLQELMEYFRE
jgi:hypothetical protein